jgi:hypothetical protein
MTMFTIYRNTRLINQHPEDPVLINAGKLLSRDIKNGLTENGADTQILFRKDTGGRLAKEAYELNVLSDTRLEICGGDSLGVMYGALAISRSVLHVDDLWYFLDTKIVKQAKAAFDPSMLQPADFHVKYRGWFVNDEVMISQWKDHDSNRYVWERIFETLVRLGGNIIIAGTDKNSHINRKPAAEFGLMTTHHHAEPLGAKMFARVYPDLEASYLKYPELFEAIWQASIEEQKEESVLWSLGFRGQGDRPFWADDSSREWTEEAKAEIINKVIRLQYDMVKSVLPDAVCAINIYGELTQMYRENLLKLPPDVLEIWADNGYGKMVSRRQNKEDLRTPVLSTANTLGNARGIYYHVAFHDLQASNFLAKLANSPMFVSTELESVRKAQMDTLVVTNTGNIKPHILFLREVALSWLADYQARNNEEILSDYMHYYPVVSPLKEQIKESYLSLFASFIQYGAHEDQKAGDEFYTYTIRKIVQALIRRADQLEEMEWLTGTGSLSDQLQFIQRLIQPKLPEWQAQFERVQRVYQQLVQIDERSATRFYNDLVLDTSVHYFGIQALNDTIKAAEEVLQDRLLYGFLRSYEAKKPLKVYCVCAKKIPRINGTIFMIMMFLLMWI